MPKPAPSHIAAKMPDGWKMWWVDGIVVNSQSLSHDQAQPGHLWPGRQLVVGEVDPQTGATYQVVLSFWMSQYDIADGDRVSLLGHVPQNATKIDAPSFIISHDSGAGCPVGLGLPDSWVVCGGSSSVGGLGMLFKAFKSGSANADLHASIWKHIQEGCSGKRGYIWPLYEEFLEWIMATATKGPNARLQQNSAGTLNF